MGLGAVRGVVGGHDMGLHRVEINTGSFGANEQMSRGTAYQEPESR